MIRGRRVGAGCVHVHAYACICMHMPSSSAKVHSPGGAMHVSSWAGPAIDVETYMMGQIKPSGAVRMELVEARDAKPDGRRQLQCNLRQVCIRFCRNRFCGTRHRGPSCTACTSHK